MERNKTMSETVAEHQARENLEAFLKTQEGFEYRYKLAECLIEQAALTKMFEAPDLRTQLWQ